MSKEPTRKSHKARYELDGTYIDPVVEEVRAIKDAHARKFNYDLEAWFKDIKASEAASGRTYLKWEQKPFSARDQQSNNDNSGAAENPNSGAE